MPEEARRQPDTRTVATRKLEDIPPAELKGFHAIITERLGIDCADEPDPVIDLKDIAELGGLAPGTPGQMRQRSKDGHGKVVFPREAPGIGERWPDKPLFRAVTDVIPYLDATGHWPPGVGARPKTRGPKTSSRSA